MVEVFRIQLRHMLGGKRKWLVAVCLVLPVLLTLASVTSGGFRELERELEVESTRLGLYQGEVPETARRVEWQGEDISFANGLLRLTRDAVLFRDQPVGRDYLVVLGGGHLIVLDGRLYVDPTKEGWRGTYYTRRLSRGRSLQSDIPSIPTICAIYLFLLYPQAICLLLALFYGTSVLGEELDGKTLTYLFTRPLPRWQFVVGKYLGIVTALVVPTGLSLLLSWLILGAPGGPVHLGGLLAGTIGALLTYNALFVLFGFLIPRRAMIVALLYGIFFELILSFVPALVNEFTITYYLRSLVVEILDVEIPREITRVVGGAGAPFALFAIAALVVVPLALSSLLAARREYVVKDTA